MHIKNVCLKDNIYLLTLNKMDVIKDSLDR